MTARRASLGMLLLALLLLGGCSSLPGGTAGSGTAKTETRPVAGFTSIELAGTGDVQVKQTGTESLTVTADDNLLPLLTTEVVDAYAEATGSDQVFRFMQLVGRLTNA